MRKKNIPREIKWKRFIRKNYAYQRKKRQREQDKYERK